MKKKARTLNDFIRKFHSNFYGLCKYVKSSDFLKNKAKLNSKLRILMSDWNGLGNLTNVLL